MSQEFKMGTNANPGGAVPNGLRPVSGVIQPSMEPNGPLAGPRPPVATFVTAGFGGGFRGPLFDAAPTPPVKTGAQLALEGCQKGYQELIAAATKLYSQELEDIEKQKLGDMTKPSKSDAQALALEKYTRSCNAADMAYAANEKRYKDK